MIGYGWGNVGYIVNFPPGEYLLYSKVSGGKIYYIVNIPGEGLLCGRFTIRHRNKEYWADDTVGTKSLSAEISTW
jgi:hypothetical protein